MIGRVKKSAQDLNVYLEHLQQPTSRTHSVANKTLMSATKPFAQRTHFAQVLSGANAFIKQIEVQSDQVQQYEDEALLSGGRSLIPVERLTLQTTLRMRSLQRSIKTGEYSATEPNFEDLFLIELVDWFRTSFFEWVDSLPCNRCGNARPASRGMRYASDGTRIEVSECCGQSLQFYRYNDVARLLLSRRGRCGEFANTFTFLCRCLGYDARLVQATFDHVWTEVYSATQRRWVHIDPSDGVIDAPLMYQHGWKRNVDYVMAYSRYEVQDVTHRYCNDHEQVSDVKDPFKSRC